MAEQHCGRNLIQITSHQLRVHECIGRQCIHVFLQVHRQKLKNQIQSIFFHQHIFQFHNIWMLQFLQQRYFTAKKRIVSSRRMRMCVNYNSTAIIELTVWQSMVCLRLLLPAESSSWQQFDQTCDFYPCRQRHMCLNANGQTEYQIYQSRRTHHHRFGVKTHTFANFFDFLKIFHYAESIGFTIFAKHQK